MDSEEQSADLADKQTTTNKVPMNLESIKIQLTSQPQVRELLVKIDAFWKVNGFKVKIGGGVVGVLIVIMIAVRIGQNIAALNRPQDAQPVAIPTVQPTVATQKPSVFDGIKLQVTNFTTLLPDPAPPAVDPKISLNPPVR